MVVAVWSVKGGVGATSVAALLALGQAERAEDVVLVDMAGDVPAVLGVDEPAESAGGPGLAEWCGLAQPTAEALARLEVEARLGLRYIPRGAGEFGTDASALLSVLAASRRQVIVDCGVVGADSGTMSRSVVEGCSTRLLVLRRCFMNLRAAQRHPITPTGVVLINEAGRSLKRSDVEAAAGAPVVAQIAADTSVGNHIDAGLVRTSLPRSLVRAMSKVLSDAA